MPTFGRSWVCYSTKALRARWRLTSLSIGRRYRHSRRTVWNQRPTFAFTSAQYGRVASESLTGGCSVDIPHRTGQGLHRVPPAPMPNVMRDDR